MNTTLSCDRLTGRCKEICEDCKRCIEEGVRDDNPHSKFLQDMINGLSGDWDVTTGSNNPGFAGFTDGNPPGYGPDNGTEDGGNINIDPGQDAPNENGNTLMHEVGHALVHDSGAGQHPAQTEGETYQDQLDYHDDSNPNITDDQVHSAMANSGCQARCNMRGCR